MTERFAEQKTRFENEEPGFEDRGLLPIYLLEDAEARNEFGVESGSFAAILVGKDGTEKARFMEPIAPDKLFRLIDGMPMRKRETRRREMERGV